MATDIEQLQEKYLKKDFDIKRFLIEAETTVRFWLSGETNGRFIDTDHPDFSSAANFCWFFSKVQGFFLAIFLVLGLAWTREKALSALPQLGPGMKLLENHICMKSTQKQADQEG